jgi:hypothetical protein
LQYNNNEHTANYSDGRCGYGVPLGPGRLCRKGVRGPYVIPKEGEIRREGSSDARPPDAQRGDTRRIDVFTRNFSLVYVFYIFDDTKDKLLRVYKALVSTSDFIAYKIMFWYNKV